MNLKLIFGIVTFIISEILPFFPSIESNGVVHGIVKIMQVKNPSIKHDCSAHPPVENVQDTIKDFSKIIKKDPVKEEEKKKREEEKKIITKFNYCGDIEKNKKFCINFRVFYK
jgi:hypothetical protein